ncbi:MAG: isoprenylcysteine carboxylmethyltransferase family protein [Ignavibacteriales bacterium]|nr:MAG: isoprenylcysteine carboxylmethyltransferase family protein [Ignavibacteriales bacterium]
MKRHLVFLYGVVSYFIFFGVFCYLPGFLGNFLVPKSIDSAASVPFAEALLINSGLLALFAVQHSVMARKGFKQMITKLIPNAAERSTYVLFSSIAVILLYWLWQPMGVTIWNVQDPVFAVVLNGLMLFGGLMVLVTTFLINHFDLFGLRQVWFYWRKQEYKPLGFVTPGPYKLVRHPLYLGWLIMFWSTPVMTIAHLVFAIATTSYILVAIILEEKDLLKEHGKKYENYRKSVPMLFPVGKKTKTTSPAFGEVE